MVWCPPRSFRPVARPTGVGWRSYAEPLSSDTMNRSLCGFRAVTLSGLCASVPASWELLPES
eukprot:4932470-Prymnesium_polylepis.2